MPAQSEDYEEDLQRLAAIADRPVQECRALATHLNAAPAQEHPVQPRLPSGKQVCLDPLRGGFAMTASSLALPFAALCESIVRCYRLVRLRG